MPNSRPTHSSPRRKDSGRNSTNSRPSSRPNSSASSYSSSGSTRTGSPRTGARSTGGRTSTTPRYARPSTTSRPKPFESREERTARYSPSKKYQSSESSESSSYESRSSGPLKPKPKKFGRTSSPAWKASKRSSTTSPVKSYTANRGTKKISPRTQSDRDFDESGFNTERRPKREPIQRQKSFDRSPRERPAQERSSISRLNDLKLEKPARTLPSRTREPKPSNKQKTMEPDFDLFVKKAKPVKMESYTAKKTFAEHGLHRSIIQALDEKSYINPTPIQDQAIPHLLEGRDIIGIANTGTGKTAAFVLPLIHKLLNGSENRVLILAPTRELAMQIEQEIKDFSYKTFISSVLIVGGVSVKPQIASLKKEKHFIVGTPGRVLDLVKQGSIKLQTINTVVLDEMDRMLDMGFVKDIKNILSLAHKKKQLLFFSATLGKEIEKIANELLYNPVHVSVKSGQTTDNVEQDVIRYRASDNKIDILAKQLQNPDVTKALIFENTKHGVDKIQKNLKILGIESVAIHGNKNQSQRNRALDAFKEGSVNVLIASNVAARGLDIPEVSHVYNYSLPQSREDYVHRIGRTGRAGNTGYAYTFVEEK